MALIYDPDPKYTYTSHTSDHTADPTGYVPSTTDTVWTGSITNVPGAPGDRNLATIEVAELEATLNHCFVCGTDDVMIVCELCREAMLEIRRMMVKKMMDEMNEMEEWDELSPDEG